MKRAFTLAEVLITLAVIGIVAALTIGIFLPKIHSQIRSHQIAVAETKFTKAMEQMALNNAIGPYYDTTQEFVDELQNYLKISKVCDNDNLADCFGYDKLLLSNGEEFDLAEIKSGENLGKTADGTDYLETVGLVTIDGTGMILSWDKKCPILEPKVYQWGGNTNETTSCVAILMDINLDKSPNRINKDIALFRAESPSKTCGIEFSVGGTDYCWGSPFIPTPLTKSECEQISSINACDFNTDYWAGAVQQCENDGKRLLNGQELAAFGSYLYGRTVPYSGERHTNFNVSGDPVNYLSVNNLANASNTLSSAYLSSNSDESMRWFGLWANVEHSSQGSWGRKFEKMNTDYYYYRFRNEPNWYAVCVK